MFVISSKVIECILGVIDRCFNYSFDSSRRTIVITLHEVQAYYSKKNFYLVTVISHSLSIR